MNKVFDIKEEFSAMVSLIDEASFHLTGCIFQLFNKDDDNTPRDEESIRSLFPSDSVTQQWLSLLYTDVPDYSLSKLVSNQKSMLAHASKIKAHLREAFQISKAEYARWVLVIESNRDLIKCANEGLIKICSEGYISKEEFENIQTNGILSYRELLLTFNECVIAYNMITQFPDLSPLVFIDLSNNH